MPLFHLRQQKIPSDNLFAFLKPLTAPKKNTTPLPKKRKSSASARKNAPIIDTNAKNLPS